MESVRGGNPIGDFSRRKDQGSRVIDESTTVYHGRDRSSRHNSHYRQIRAVRHFTRNRKNRRHRFSETLRSPQPVQVIEISARPADPDEEFRRTEAPSGLSHDAIPRVRKEWTVQCMDVADRISID
jgi:hypothetical protein